MPVGAAGAGPYALTTGPDGALWGTLVYASQIACLDLDGLVGLYPLDSLTCRPSQITTVPD